MKISQTSWFMALAAILCLTNFYGQKTIIKTSGIRSEKGQIILNVFKNSEDYQQEKVSKKII